MLVSQELHNFIEACIRKGEAEEVGDSRKGNKQYKTIHSVYLRLKDNNLLSELLPLLDHENAYVRLWAAAYTLQVSQPTAESTLKSLANLKGNIGFVAEMTLREWKNGNIKY